MSYVDELTDITPRLSEVLHEIRRIAGCELITRIAVALYDDRTNSLRTIGSATMGADPLVDYEVSLDAVPSLAILAAGTQARIVDDLSQYGRNTSAHTLALRAAGYRASLTVPVNLDGRFLGFVFFNSPQVGLFTAQMVDQLLTLSAALLVVVRRRLAAAPAARRTDLRVPGEELRRNRV